ncbi:MAG TPA: alpha/beta fold hydrolase, partial [Usitatibacter sp.]|nr:alpha/beta fold hydrolase [Usitatibacter sp.]
MTPLHHLVEGRGEPVVLVHAIGCDHRMWDSLASDLAARYRVVRVDVRGHGESPVPPGEYSLKALAEDVLAVLDGLKIEKAHWVGLSMGGMIGQAFALAHPDRLGRLVLANTTSGYGPDGPKMWEARMKAVRDGGMAAIAELVMQRYFSDAFRERHPEVVARMKER